MSIYILAFLPLIVVIAVVVIPTVLAYKWWVKKSQEKL